MSSRLSSIFGNAKSQDDIENGCRSIDVENGLGISDSAVSFSPFFAHKDNETYSECNGLGWH